MSEPTNTDQAIDAIVYQEFAQHIAALNMMLYHERLNDKWQRLEALSMGTDNPVNKVADIFATYEPTLTSHGEAEVHAQVEANMLDQMRQALLVMRVPQKEVQTVVDCLYVQQLAVNYAHHLYIQETENDPEMVDVQELDEATRGMRKLLINNLAKCSDIEPAVAEALVERYEQEAAHVIAQLKARVSAEYKDGVMQIPDTGWYDNHQELIQQIMDSAREARNKLRTLPPVDEAHGRLEQFQDEHNIAECDVQSVTEMVREMIFHEGKVDSQRLKAQIHENAPQFLEAIQKNPPIILDLVNVSAVEVMIQGLMQAVIAQYCDRPQLKEQHQEAEADMKAEFKEVLGNLGIGPRAADLEVNAFATHVHKACRSAMGLGDANRSVRLN